MHQHSYQRRLLVVHMYHLTSACFVLSAYLFSALFIYIPIAVMAQYNDAVLNITPIATPDPYVTYANNKVYLVCPSRCNQDLRIDRHLTALKTYTAGDRVEIWSAGSLPELHDHAEKSVIWYHSSRSHPAQGSVSPTNPNPGVPHQTPTIPAHSGRLRSTACRDDGTSTSQPRTPNTATSPTACTSWAGPQATKTPRKASGSFLDRSGVWI